MAQLTWIVEKVEAWTHDSSKFTDQHYRDRHLANVLLYWLTRTATSAAENVYAAYGELFADPAHAFASSGVPTRGDRLRRGPVDPTFAEHGNTIVRWTDVDDGGHFAALEQPESLVLDLREFVRNLE